MDTLKDKFNTEYNTFLLELGHITAEILYRTYGEDIMKALEY